MDAYEYRIVLYHTLMAVSTIMNLSTAFKLNMRYTTSIYISRCTFDIGAGFIPIGLYNFFNFVLLASLGVHFYIFGRPRYCLVELTKIIITSMLINIFILYIIIT